MKRPYTLEKDKFTGGDRVMSANEAARQLSIIIVTSIHPDFDSRIWKHAKLAARTGHKIRLICPWDVPHGSVQDGVEFHPFPKAPSRMLRPVWSFLQLLPRLLSIIRSADIIHFHDLDLLPIMTAVALFKPVVFDVHENYPDEMLEKAWIPKALRAWVSWTVKWGQWASCQVIRNVVLVAPSQERYFSSRRLRKEYIYNFASRDLATDADENYREREPTVVFIGSQHENNGSLLMLDVAALVRQAVPEITFQVVDRFIDSAFRAEFMEKRRQLGLEDTVQLFANIKPHELMSILNRATIGISPNLRVPQQINGIHTKIFEYMAAGLPMVVSDLPHQVEVIGKSAAGIVVPPEQPEKFAEAVVALSKDKALAAAMGARGRDAFTTHYCYESQQSKLVDFYLKILNGNP